MLETTATLQRKLGEYGNLVHRVQLFNIQSPEAKVKLILCSLSLPLFHLCQSYLRGPLRGSRECVRVYLSVKMTLTLVKDVFLHSAVFTLQQNSDQKTMESDER